MTQIPGPGSAKLNAALINVINHTCAFPVKMSAVEKDPLTGSVIADRPEAAVKKKKLSLACISVWLCLTGASKITSSLSVFVLNYSVRMI